MATKEEKKKSTPRIMVTKGEKTNPRFSENHMLFLDTGIVTRNNGA